MTPERALRLAQDARARHLAARADDLSLVECAVLIREAKTLEQEARSMRARCAERDGRIAKCALNNPEMTQRELGERFGISWQAVSRVLQDAGIVKTDGGLDGKWYKKEES